MRANLATVMISMTLAACSPPITAMRLAGHANTKRGS
jgi:hypothetical protein